MSFKDVKEFQGRPYSGMAIGGTHAWTYPDGRWRERKLAPDRWEFTFASQKRRQRSAPPGSGALPGTEYHWYILAHQRVRKLDADTYRTFMEGTKYKVAHKRPHWKNWSTEYPDQPGERIRLIAILEEALLRLTSEPERASNTIAMDALARVVREPLNTVADRIVNTEPHGSRQSSEVLFESTASR